MEFKESKSQKDIFIIMPFIETPTRNQAQLTSFFENNIRRPIEAVSLKYDYRIWRSGEAFNITDEIIKDLYRADIVIADLSGEYPNPNVMYELGVRLAISEKPVILIREKNQNNRRVFDVENYYIHAYDPLNYTELEKHLVSKVERLETGEESFESPIKKALHDELVLSQSKLSSLSPSQQRQIVLQGANLVKMTISSAFGPLGKGIPITNREGFNTFAKRGYDIAKAAWSSNPLENRGIEFLSEVARIMIQKVGDGSKLAILLTYDMMEAGNEALKNGYRTKDIVLGMKRAVNEVIAYINKQKHFLKDEAEVVSVAATASKNKDIGHIITECLDKVGKHGLIKLVKSDSENTSYKIIEGIQFERGYISPDFVPRQNSAYWIYDNCYILLYPNVISNYNELMPILEKTCKAKIPLVIIAKDVIDSAMETLLFNVQKGIVQVIAVKIPAINNRSINLLDDIAIRTGGKVVSSSRGLKLSNMDIKDLGQAEKVIVTEEYTRIIGGAGNIDDIKKRINQIDELLESTSNIYEAEKCRERLAMLVGAFAIITIGGVTSQEVDERYYGYYSALNAAISAISEGVVIGGTLPLYLAKEKLSKITLTNQYEKCRIIAIKKSLETPLFQLISNFNLLPEDIVNKIPKKQSSTIGFNAESGIVEDLLAAGIKDPVQILITALEVARSHSKMFIETSTWADQKLTEIEK
jgi:chaperonin GroEL